MADKLETLLRRVVDPNGGTDVPAIADRIKGMLPGFTFLEMEAALCVWECISEWTLSDCINGPGRPEWIELREDVGSAELRHQSITLGKWCVKVYDICTKHDKDFFDGVSYDWEVIPLIMDFAADDDGRPVINEKALPPPEKVALLVARRHLLREYLTSCRHEAQKQWAYGDLVEDHPEKFEAAFADDEEPADIVKAIGEDLDLIDFGPWR